MGNNTAELLKSVEDLSAESLRQLFALQNLDIDSELELVLAAERWLHARRPAASPAPLQENSADIDMSDSTEVADGDEETERNTTVYNGLQEQNDAKMLIRDAVKEIRFLAMEPDEFASHDFSTLLSTREMLAITFNYLSEETYLAMPDGFSKSREKRNIPEYIDR